MNTHVTIAPGMYCCDNEDTGRVEVVNLHLFVVRFRDASIKTYRITDKNHPEARPVLVNGEHVYIIRRD
jgi:hypothetical protein